MKSLLLFLCIVCTASLTIISPGHARPPLPNELPPTPITKAFLRLYEDKEMEVRLGAMLVSGHAGFDQDKPLVQALKQGRKQPESLTETTFRNYAIALLQGNNNDADNLRFVQEFPEKPDELMELFAFEKRFKAPPSSYLLELLLTYGCYGGDDQISIKAKKKVQVLQQRIGDWGYYGEQLDTCKEK
ncbi:hypothetical protein [Desulfovibrio cuneatus]|uniref:hypothetical protein n=1 Tax=Desulfovibrio cuneatus TaxID=159728 RepID=UPI000424EA06|nr:hypothetical protein [Desulfovibrio cuneatus]